MTTLTTAKLNYLTVEQIRKAFSIHRNTVYKLAATGVLKAVRFPGNRRMYFDRDDIVQALKGVSTKGKAE